MEALLHITVLVQELRERLLITVYVSVCMEQIFGCIEICIILINNLVLIIWGFKIGSKGVLIPIRSNFGPMSKIIVR